MARGVLALCAGLALAMPAHAGMQEAPCKHPYAFRGAAVNIIVLPFSMPMRSSSATDRLSLLVQREALRSAAKFGSVGAVQLVQSGGEPCLAETVRAQLLGEQPGAAGPGVERGLVLFWGRVIEQGDALYLQAFVDFVRRGRRETLELPLGNARLRARLSAQGFAGPQRSITRGQLQRIDEVASRSQLLYGEPNEASPKTSIPANTPFSYFVTDVRGDWMRVLAFTPNDMPVDGRVAPAAAGVLGSKWMKATVAEPEWSLRQFLPEMAFVEAVAGYLVARDAIERSPDTGRVAPMLDAARRALAEYRETMSRRALESEQGWSAERYAAAQAVSAELAGLLHALAAPRTAETMRQAREQFAAASRLQPANADSRNLTLITDLWLAERAPSPDEPAVRATDSLRQTLSLAPDHPQVPENLRTAYRWMLARSAARPAAGPPLPPGAERGRIETQLRALETLPR
jgi:hypothetical protein